MKGMPCVQPLEVIKKLGLKFSPKEAEPCGFRFELCSSVSNGLYVSEVSGSAGRASRKAKYPDPCIPRSYALRIDDQWSEQKDVLIGAL